MPQSRLVVVVPAGPKDDAADTLRSVLYYTDPELLLVIDDTHGRGIGLDDPRVVIFTPPSSPPGPFGGLWVKLAAAFRHVTDHAEFDLLLRLDTDALILGPGIAEAAAERFSRDPALGALGAYRVGPDGGTRDWKPAANMVKAELGLRGMRHTAARRRLRTLIAQAPEYATGEHALGAAVVFRADMVREWSRRGMLDYPELGDCMLGEDHLFGLLTAAAGYRTGDFSGPDDPLAVRWLGLPAAPADLLAAGKLITHSVRSWENMGEGEIRAFFAAHRSAMN
jgi:hypothetical protein